MPTLIRLLFLTALIVGGLSACSERGGPGQDKRPLAGGLKEREVPRVRTTPVEMREMVRTISTSEPLESEREIEVFPRVAGIVETLAVEEGDRVTRGQVLCVLEQAQQLAAVADATVAEQEAKDRQPTLEVGVRQAAESIKRAELTYNQAKAEFDRNNDKGLISRNDLEKLRLSMDQAFRDWQAAILAEEAAQTDLDAVATTIKRAGLMLKKEELNLAWTEVTAPFDGVISLRSVEVGDSVSSSTGLFTLTDTDRVRVVIHRPQRELAFFANAAARAAEPIEILAWPDALPGESYAGAIRIVSPTIDPASGSFRLTIDLEQPAPDSARPRLLPGMLVRLDVVVERHADALVVPKRALRREGDRRFLFAVREGKARRVDVREGFTNDESIEILLDGANTLVAGEQVVVVGNRDLEDGTAVEIEDWRAEGDPEAAVDTAPGEEETTDLTTAETGDEGVEPETVANEGTGDGAGSEPEQDTATPDDEG